MLSLLLTKYLKSRGLCWPEVLEDSYQMNLVRILIGIDSLTWIMVFLISLSAGWGSFGAPEEASSCLSLISRECYNCFAVNESCCLIWGYLCGTGLDSTEFSSSLDWTYQTFDCCFEIGHQSFSSCSTFNYHSLCNWASKNILLEIFLISINFKCLSTSQASYY